MKTIYLAIPLVCLVAAIIAGLAGKVIQEALRLLGIETPARM